MKAMRREQKEKEKGKRWEGWEMGLFCY